MPTVPRLPLLLAAGLLVLSGGAVRAEPAQPGTAIPQPVTVAPAATSGQIGLEMPPVLAPNPGPGMPFELDDTSPTPEQPVATKNEWVMAPIPFVSPVVGFGLALGAGYIYHPPGHDEKLPPWVTGIGGFYSDNQSWAVAVGHKMNLANDTWRLFGLAGYGELNYDFYGIGDSAAANNRLVSLNQTVAGVTFEGLYRIREHLYAGLNYSASKVTTKYAGGSNLPTWVDDILTSQKLAAVLSMPSLRMQWDSRDSTFFPRRGSLVDGEVVFSDEAFGSDFNYQAIAITARHYWRLSDTQTMAVYGWGRFAYGDVPFFALSMIGAKGNLRGYPAGRYQDMMAMTGQIEYRWQMWRRLGVVAFGGLGAVAPDLSGFTDTTTLPSVGVGVRYLLTEKNRLNFRLDVAWGRDEQLLYVGVGEAF